MILNTDKKTISCLYTRTTLAAEMGMKFYCCDRSFYSVESFHLLPSRKLCRITDINNGKASAVKSSEAHKSFTGRIFPSAHAQFYVTVFSHERNCPSSTWKTKKFSVQTVIKFLISSSCVSFWHETKMNEKNNNKKFKICHGKFLKFFVI